MKTGKRQFWMSLIARQVALLAVLLWAILPPGLMPVRGSDGGPAFALCSGAGPVLVEVGPDGTLRPVTPDGAGHEKNPCPFAAAMPGLERADNPLSGAVTGEGTGLTPLVADAAPTPVPSHLRPAPRAPPFLS